MPFAHRLEDLIQKRQDTSESFDYPAGTQLRILLSEIFPDIISSSGKSHIAPDASPTLSTRVFLSHGTDDVWVPVELGRQAARILQMMNNVGWNEFTGADGDGHWIKEPEGFDQILIFPEQKG